MNSYPMHTLLNVTKGLIEIVADFKYYQRDTIKIFNDLAPDNRVGACFHLTC